jgi:hypothetical protein
MIEGEPNTPTVMIKANWKGNGYHKERGEHELIMCVYDRHRRQVSDEDNQLGRNHIYQDRTYKESLLTLKYCLARRAAVFYLEQAFDD